MNIGIIGFGMIGKVHAYAYAAMPFCAAPINTTFRITHVATARKETAERAKAMCGAEVATTDYRDITENPNIDIVHLCTPNDLHAEPLISAIRHRKKIYCDKPLAASLAEAERVQAALEESNYTETNQMTFHLRFFPALIRAKKLLDAETLGRILQFRVGFFHSSNASPSAPFKWKHSSSGGAVRDLGSHLLDLTDHLLGPFASLLADTTLAFPRRPIATGSQEFRGVESEDAVSMLVRLESGATGVIEATKLATGNEDEMILEIHGEKGAVRFRLMQPHYLEFFDATLSDRPLGGDVGWKRIPCGGRFETPDNDFPSPKSSIGWPRAHVACLSNFLHAVVEERQTAPDLRQGIKIDRLIDDVLRSAAERRWVIPRTSIDFLSQT